MKMTYNEAMNIQQAQAVYYRQSIGRAGIKAIKARTFCPADLNPNEPIFIGTINGLVPRGGCFETYIRHIPVEYDGTKHAWHDAMRAGKIYSS
jgi:hypothetical protein